MIYFVALAVGGASATIYHNYLLGNKIIPDETVVGFKLIRTVDLSRERIFSVMADIEKYPKILPQNFISVKIINQTDNAVGKVVFAEERVSEAGVITTLVVKHTIVPYQIHTVEIMGGDASGTIIRADYREIDSGTEITTDAQIHLHGILSPFGFLAQHNLEHATDTIITRFVEYAHNQTNT